MRSAFIKLHLAVFLAGFTAILGKLISLNSFGLVWWRLLFTVLGMLLLASVLRRTVNLKPATRWKLLGIGAVIAIHWLTFFGSIKFSSVSITLVTFSSAGFFSALLEPFFTRKKIDWLELILGLICIFGIYIIFRVDNSHGLGIALGLASAALAAMYAILNKKILSPGLSGFTITYWEMIGAFATVSVAASLFFLVEPFAFMPLPLDWIWIVILALLCTIWPWFLQIQALHYLNASTVNLSYNLEPVYGIILAVIIFRENEEMGPSFFLGTLIIAIAVGIQTWRILHAQKQKEDKAATTLPV